MKLSHDLSEHHQLISDLFPSISSKEAWENISCLTNKSHFLTPMVFFQMLNY
jgi:hypothetical protein